jgi:hypothetical protein
MRNSDPHPMHNRRRWVLYANSGRRDRGFADAVVSAGRFWKPLSVQPYRIDEAIKAVEPEAVVVAADQPDNEGLLRRTFALHGKRRLVVDDRHLEVLTRLLEAADCP